MAQPQQQTHKLCPKCQKTHPASQPCPTPPRQVLYGKGAEMIPREFDGTVVIPE